MKKITSALLTLVLSASAVAQQPLRAPSVAPSAAPRDTKDGFNCVVEPSLSVSVGSPVDGVLQRVAVDRGDAVTKGQVVAQLRSGVEAASVALSRSRIEFDKRKVERNETLFNKQLISEQERDEMVTEATLHEGELKKELENLNLRTIVSPLNGVVVERVLGPGELIRADKSVVLKLAQLNPLNIEVITPAALFGTIHAGMKGAVNLAPYFKEIANARVVVVDKVIDPASGTFWVRLQLPNPGNKIPAGIRCSVEFLRQ
jgi:membrane fusion protein (multidrug efflux system)